MASDLISRSAAIGCLGNTPSQMCMPWSEVERMLRELPAVAPIARAHWQRGYGDRPTCSRCTSISKEESFYCPWCGAYMQRGEEYGK